MNRETSTSHTGSCGPRPCACRWPGVGAIICDFLIGTVVAVTGFILIWAQRDWVSIAGAFLSTAGALLMLVTAVRTFKSLTG